MLAQANAIHHALERFFGLPGCDRSVESLHRALRAVWSQHRAGAFASRDEEAFYGREALELLSLFASNFALDVQPLAREQRIRMRVGEALLTGKIDRIDSAVDGDGVEIVDYKTGLRPIEREDIAGEPATQVYVLAAEALFRRPVVKVRLIYLRTGEVCWEPEREDIDALRLELARVCAEITSAVEYPANPGAHCDWCPYSLLCEERQRVELDDLAVPEGIPF